MFLVFLFMFELGSCVFITKFHFGLDEMYHSGCWCVICFECNDSDNGRHRHWCA
jgi:hypothetical protein